MSLLLGSVLGVGTALAAGLLRGGSVGERAAGARRGMVRSGWGSLRGADCVLGGWVSVLGGWVRALGGWVSVLGG